MLDIDEMVTGHLKCALWTETDEEDIPLDTNYSLTSFSMDAMAKAKMDCLKFAVAAGGYFDLSTLDSDNFGHNFWLNRNGHGSGFWDRDEIPEEFREPLSKLAHSFGERHALEACEGEIDLY